jgi:hypothetical protein
MTRLRFEDRLDNPHFKDFGIVAKQRHGQFHFVVPHDGIRVMDGGWRMLGIGLLSRQHN